MDQKQKETLITEYEEIAKRLKADFPSPADMRRKEQIASLLMTNGESDKLNFKLVKHKSQRVTSFTRDRR